MISYCRHLFFYFLVILFLGCESVSQTSAPEISKKKVLYSDLQQFGLRGKVKTVRMGFEFLSDSLIEIYNRRSTYSAREFKTEKAEKNDVSLRLFKFGPREEDYGNVFYFQEYDSLGFLIKRHLRPLDSLSQPIDSLGYSTYEYSEADILEKSFKAFADSLRFPVVAGLAVLPNRNYPFGKYKQFEINHYDIEDDLIRAHRHYSETDTFKVNLGDFKPDTAFLKFKASYEYNPAKQLVAINYEQMASSDYYDANSVLLIAGLRRTNDIRVEFTYNEAGQQTLLRIMDDKGGFLYQETHFYSDNKLVETERLGYKNLRLQAADAHKSILTYDDFGNITKAAYYDIDFGERIIWTNYYNYTYDDRNNWISCTIYTDNDAKKASGILNRAIEYWK